MTRLEKGASSLSSDPRQAGKGRGAQQGWNWESSGAWNAHFHLNLGVTLFIRADKGFKISVRSDLSILWLVTCSC